MRWLQIKGFEGLYEVNDLGEIYSLGRVRKARNQHKEYLMIKKPKKLSPGKNRSGYLSVVLYDKNGTKKTMKLHRIVAIAFIQNPKPSEYNMINHIDGNKLNNKVENLEWCNNSENVQHAFDNNLSKATYGNAKLTKDDVYKIRELHKNTNLSYREIADRFGVWKTTVHKIVHNLTWNTNN